MNEKRSTDGRSTISLATSKDKHTLRTTQEQEGHATRVQDTTSTDLITSTVQLNSLRSMEKTIGQLSIGTALKSSGTQLDQHLSPETTSGTSVGGALMTPNTPTTSTQNNSQRQVKDHISQSKHTQALMKRSLQEDSTTSLLSKEHHHYLLRNPSYPRSKRQLLKASASLSTSCQLQQSFPHVLKDPQLHLFQ